MKKMLIGLVLTLLMACTAVDYESPWFGDKTRAHTTIAVLPFEMVFTGKIPAGLTPHDVARIEEIESLAFQEALYDALLNQASAHRKVPITIGIQSIEVTNEVLEADGLDLRQTWEMDAAELADLLGVDAVVRTTVTKTRYMSDLASYGTGVGIHVLHEVAEGQLDWLIPPGLTTTHDIYADSELINGEDGGLLWKVAALRETDWHRPANDVVVGLTRKLAKKFPYRVG